VDSADLAIQAAVRTKLLEVLSVGVYDQSPRQSKLPYVTIGEPDILPFNTKTWDGTEAGVTVHVWSASDSPSEGRGIAETCVNTLHDSTLSIGSGYEFVACRFSTQGTIIQPDGVRHTVCRFRVLVKEA